MNVLLGCREEYPTTGELETIAQAVSRTVLAALGDSSVEPEGDDALAPCAAASAQGVVALGARHGQRPLVLLGTPRHRSTAAEQRRVEVDGFGVYADARLAPGNPEARFRLCRYLARPPLSTQRLRRYRSGKLVYVLKRPFADGTEAVILEPLDLMARLAALVPAPRMHLIRYHGVLSGHARERRAVVPAQDEPPHGQLHLWPAAERDTERTSRVPWAKLLARVFKIDVAVCPICQGCMRILEWVMPPREPATPRPGHNRGPPAPLQLRLQFTG